MGPPHATFGPSASIHNHEDHRQQALGRFLARFLLIIVGVAGDGPRRETKGNEQ